MTRATIIMLTLSAFSAAAGQLLFKVGARDSSSWIDFINLPILCGLVLYCAATGLWIYTLSYVKLVNVYAFTALTFVLVYAGGVAILGERISTAGAMGVFLVLSGLYLITNYNT